METESDVAVQRRAQFHKDAEEHRKKLFARVYSWTHDIELTEETVQIVFVKYLAEREANGWQKHIRNELAYLTTMARNLLIDARRIESRTEWFSLDDELDHALMKIVAERSDGFNVENKIYFNELLKALPLNTILGNFGPEKTELIKLYYFQDFADDEIAEKLNIHKDLVAYWIKGIETTVRARVRKIYGKKGLFTSDS